MKPSTIFKRGIVILLLGALSGMVQAATNYCIDPNPDGDNSHEIAAGCSATYNSIAEFDNSGIALVGGDKVLLKRGRIFREQLDVTASGSGESGPIVYSDYGDVSLPRPKIMRTDLYDNWWQDSWIHNGGMEVSAPATGGAGDDFSSWVTGGTPSTDCHVAVDNAVKHSGNASMKFTCDPPVESYVRTTAWVQDLKDATAYTLTAHARGTVGKLPEVSVGFKYHQPDSTKKYIGFNDITGEPEWRDTELQHWLWQEVSTGDWETLTLTTPPTLEAGGTFEILFVTWGTDGTWLDDVTLEEVGTTEKVWAGINPEVKFSAGAIMPSTGPVGEDRRYPRIEAKPQGPATGTPPEFSDYLDYVLAAQAGSYAAGKMQENRYYQQYDTNHPFFYIRNDAGSPGPVEVGAREQTIFVNGASFIEIENIDVVGPGAEPKINGQTKLAASFVIEGTSNNVSVRNVDVSLSQAVGLNANTNTYEIHFDNINAHGNASTGIYLNAALASLTNSHVHHNGNVLYDKIKANGVRPADAGGIGSQGRDQLIAGNRVHHNGPDGPDGYSNPPVGYEENLDGDMEISINPANTTGITIKNNHVYDCIQGCIQIAGASDSTIAYNIIDGFGDIHNLVSNSTYGKWGGIRIGSKDNVALLPRSENIGIYNNVITGGKVTNINHHAAIMFYCGRNSGADIRNNVIYGNTSRHVFVANVQNHYFCDPAKNNNNSNLTFSNNIFEADNGQYGDDYGWWLYDQTATDLAGWQALSETNGNGTITGVGSQVGDPQFVNPNAADYESSDYHLASMNSIAVNTGIDVDLAEDHEGSPVVDDPVTGNSPEVGAFIYPDFDVDTVLDTVDNCPFHANLQQVDTDSDGTGDVCDDSDRDGIVDGSEDTANNAHLDIFAPNGEGWNLSRVPDFSDIDASDESFDEGETLHILAWSNQFNANDVRVAQALLSVNGSETVIPLTNALDGTYQGQLVLGEAHAGNATLDIEILAKRNDSYTPSIPMVINPLIPPSPVTITIVTPPNNTQFPLAWPVRFLGGATEVEPGDRNHTMSWTSDLAGLLGTGHDINRYLGAGTHIIDVTATNSNGVTYSAAPLRIISGDPSDCSVHRNKNACNSDNYCSWNSAQRNCQEK